MSHIKRVLDDTFDKGMYNAGLSLNAAYAIAAARISRNIGFKAGVAYARKRGIKMSLVRLAMQLEAMRKHGFVLGDI